MMAELQELIALHPDDIFEGEIPDHFFEEVAPEEGVEILHDNSHVVGQVVNPAAVWTEPQIQLLNRLNHTMTKTNQNRKKLELEDHLFKKNRPGKVGIDGYTPIYWNCDTPGCGGWAMTLRENPDDESDDINARLTSEHSNGLDGDTVFCRQVENCHVLTSKATQLIINMCLESNTNYQTVEDEVRALLQAYNPLINTKLNTRGLAARVSKLRAAVLPPVPHENSHAEFVVPEARACLPDGRPFLLHSIQYVHTNGQPGRIMIFGSLDFLANLYRCERIQFHVEKTTVPYELIFWCNRTDFSCLFRDYLGILNGFINRRTIHFAG